MPQLKKTSFGRWQVLGYPRTYGHDVPPSFKTKKAAEAFAKRMEESEKSGKINPGKSRRFERCVKGVKASTRKSGRHVDSPEAVCAASLRKTGWTPQGNPSHEERKAFLETLSRGELLKLTRSIGISANRLPDSKIRSLLLRHGDKYGKNPCAGLHFHAGDLRAQNVRKRNPDGAASAIALTKKFHGRALNDIIDVAEVEKYPKDLGFLGELVQLRFVTPKGDDATVNFDKSGVLLTASPGTQTLYLTGGDQSINLKPLGMSGKHWVKDLMVLGKLNKRVADSVVYRAEKGFDQFVPLEYQHRAGEEGGEPGTVLYDSINKKIRIGGGTYFITAGGLHD